MPCGKGGTTMLYLSKLSKDFGEKTIFDCIDLSIYDGEKVGIVGDNGVGKSTLLNIIAGLDDDYSGLCKIDGTVAYLRQSSFTDFNTLKSVLLDKEQSGRLLYNLKLLGFVGDIHNVDKLSCGERTKLAFALEYIKNPQTLLLDEPTNHLDIGGKKVLLNLIGAFKGTVIAVSHDIDFLNAIAQKIIEISNTKIKEYAGNYNSFKHQKELELISKERDYITYTKKVKEIKENIEFIRKFADKAERDVGRQDRGNGSGYMQTKTKAMVHAKKMNKTVASRISRLEHQLDNAPDKPEVEREIKYRFDANPLKSKVAVKFEDVEFGYSTLRALFESLNFEIKSGEKVGIIGNNGTGKTTLINLIVGKLQCQKGNIIKAGSLNIAHLEQDIYDLDENMTINEMSKSGDAYFRTSFITNLINMNIDKTRFNTKTKYLSLGERMRIKLNQIILSDANFIILDEPTNHLDIANKEFLKKVLANFKGTVLTISHDLDFINATTDRVYALQNCQLKEVFKSC